MLSSMESEIGILSVEQDGDSGVLVKFSDGTTAGYLVEELLELRPARLAFREAEKLDHPGDAK